MYKRLAQESESPPSGIWGLSTSSVRRFSLEMGGWSVLRRYGDTSAGEPHISPGAPVVPRRSIATRPRPSLPVGGRRCLC